ncbi:hypothetical protein [Streptomyces tauricus]|uniref:hypothetical protein n=1 Tax=Streptomyces tauricus TaxID=68274 RepID=UPI0033ACDDB8
MASDNRDNSVEEFLLVSDKDLHAGSDIDEYLYAEAQCADRSAWQFVDVGSLGQGDDQMLGIDWPFADDAGEHQPQNRALRPWWQQGLVANGSAFLDRRPFSEDRRSERSPDCDLGADWNEK